MNKIRKMLAITSAAAMVFTMSTTAFADGAVTPTVGGTITIDGLNDVTDAKTGYIQIIKADRTTRTGWAFASEQIAGCFSGYPGADDQAKIEELIKNDGGYSSELSVALSNVAASVTADSTSISYTVSEAGLYLIKAVGTNYTFNNMTAFIGIGADGTLGDAVVNAKKSPITVTKSQTEADTVADQVAAFDDIITYTIETYVPYIDSLATNKEFKVVDELSGADYYLTGTGSTYAVVMGTTDITDGHGAVMDSDKNGFAVDLSNLIDASNSNAGNKVTITYTAKVTGTSVVNTAAGHKSGSQYGSGTTNLYSGKVTVVKADASDSTKKLAGAGFEVSDGTKTLNFRLVDGVYRYTTEQTGTEGTVTEIVTGADGTVKVEGLNVGTYSFTEKTAPVGYSVNTQPVSVQLAVDGEKATAVITQTGTCLDTKLGALPSTGGMGTTLFTIAGNAMMIFAAAMFFVSRRRVEE